MSNSHTAAEIRAELGRQQLTQGQLAQKISAITGRQVPHMWVSRRLTGATTIDLDDLALIAQALDVDPKTLVQSAAPA